MLLCLRERVRLIQVTDPWRLQKVGLKVTQRLLETQRAYSPREDARLNKRQRWRSLRCSHTLLQGSIAGKSRIQRNGKASPMAPIPRNGRMGQMRGLPMKLGRFTPPLTVPSPTPGSVRSGWPGAPPRDAAPSCAGG